MYKVFLNIFFIVSYTKENIFIKPLNTFTNVCLKKPVARR